MPHNVYHQWSTVFFRSSFRARKQPSGWNSMRKRKPCEFNSMPKEKLFPRQVHRSVKSEEAHVCVLEPSSDAWDLSVAPLIEERAVGNQSFSHFGRSRCVCGFRCTLTINLIGAACMPFTNIRNSFLSCTLYLLYHLISFLFVFN